MSTDTIPTTAPEPAASDRPLAQDLVVRLEGFDGPLDLLMSLAHEQKVDLSAISISALAEQYLVYINAARRLRLEIAADYLVMAAWLAFLKSRLLLPAPPNDEPDPGDMAAALKFQLQRLAAMQQAAEKMRALPQLGSEIFLRGIPEPIRRIEKPVYDLKLYDLLQALAAPQRRIKAPRYTVPQWRLISLEAALTRIRNMVGFMPSWTALHEFVPDLTLDPLETRSAIASTFAASLEMVKSGELELRQEGIFTPIYIRKTEAPSQNEESRT
ncbi:MAG: ScpA family protein [Alphaproteobacteria bacterium]